MGVSVFIRICVFSLSPLLSFSQLLLEVHNLPELSLPPDSQQRFQGHRQSMLTSQHLQRYPEDSAQAKIEAQKKIIHTTAVSARQPTHSRRDARQRGRGLNLDLCVSFSAACVFDLLGS